MDKSKALTNYNKVLNVLKENDSARDDDFTCWAYILLKNNRISANEFKFLSEISERSKGETFEAVSRARRRVQADHPELTNNEKQFYRTIEEENYREAYRG